ncbi:thiol reductant ABC exporter subunit CydC [Microlunatus sp. Gsoil 973]|uniref:thiol reductant ABC exporter subunit CydC n=1 Tax=Microlunatus sp. Gsoil 973 TaxID=2672569 RepID=UPI0012B48C10|nr:thiol reductant ABC exporter subunit CydC [Microlunatus sp. Gsoil 973]QGN34604.1 thiol reductant ABC exporter subunit CydC [Microlunatus sp. Gsoil 973]
MITLLSRLVGDSRQRLGSLLRPVVLGVVAQLSAVGLMAVSAWLLSRAAQHPPVLYLMCAIVAVRALGLARGVFRYRERLAGHDIALGLQASLRVRAYQRLADGSALRRSGDLLTRVTSDLDAVQDLVVRVIVPAVSTALVIVAAGTALSVISAPAGVLLLAGSAVSGAVLPWCAGRLAARAADQLVPLRARLADEVAEIGRSREDLVAFGAEPAALDRLAAIDARLAAAERRTAWTSGLMTALQWLCTGAVIIGSMIIGGRAVAAGTVDPVFLAVLALTPLALHEVVATLPATAVVWRRTRAALQRARELIAPVDPAPLVARLSAEPGVPLAIRRLTAGWPGAVPVVRDLDLVVRAGERVALVGPSGIGKSTLAATVMGHLPPLAGSLAVAERVGYLAQDAHIFDTTVAENVRIGARAASDDQVRRALGEVDLDFPADRLVGEFGAALSGGEARRLALSRLAVARLVDGDHQLLVLDEPTEHLDRDTADHVLEVIGRLDRRAAVLVITHDPRVMERCDRVVSLTGTAAGTAPASGAAAANAGVTVSLGQ